ncbi:glycoprotein-N-acetylgalactosamine 3-beta-galactosyltransferase 1-like [Gigantopelta aegis]|uniref:glycoprotein-N-acetylgalactosamine 3-beta-galactosyltransferase 1-like n=1 Tax=Gigantopelta aegis TaxID=1735272 RepID=UPI001B88D7C2|nr:glycoprotein-N-acetylgalactosamine 3-beta-galactosyltransferase 1-like [Gigantopelta aegis]XP_041363540.1 glycoprotein-N-acetylgalactosamine 3-beta-galactosyltransferase 1-like [Gigantopelta aegis]
MTRIGTTHAARVNFLIGFAIGFGIAGLLAFVNMANLHGTAVPYNSLLIQQMHRYDIGHEHAAGPGDMYSRGKERHITSHKELDEDRGTGGRDINLDSDSHFHHDDNILAKKLEKTVRVLCWIMTSPKNLDTRAVHVRNTWGKRCNKLLFFSSETNTTFPTIGLNVTEGRNHLTAKTIGAFRYVYEHFYDEADWFMKADDDTYVIVENLRYFLSDHNTSQPVYFGHKFKKMVKQGYFSGGAGYVLSRQALKTFVEKGSNTTICKQDGGAEDAEIGKCMSKLGIVAGNSTDMLGRSRFHCFDAETHLFGGYPKWYYNYDADGAKQGQENISDYAVSFHYVRPLKMYSMEFFVYHLRPYGIISQTQSLNFEKGL